MKFKSHATIKYKEVMEILQEKLGTNNIKVVGARTKINYDSRYHFDPVEKDFDLEVEFEVSQKNLNLKKLKK